MESSQNPSLYAKKLGHKFVGLYLNALVDGDLNTALEFYVPEAVLTRSHPQTGDRTLNGTEVSSISLSFKDHSDIDL